ncbi:hypothetical protein ACP4OV_021971 [Aristida adscensionis]
MASVGLALLLVAAQLHTVAPSSAHAYGNLTHHSVHCHPDQANTLLKLKQSFIFDSYSISTLPSWQAGSDCCLWEGVGCSNSSGLVTILDLSGLGLYSQGLDPVLFNLTSLRLLDLSMNAFGYYGGNIPTFGFERLAFLTHLNLSNSEIGGQVPIGIGKLINLVSLDLSSTILWAPYFTPLVVNLSSLRELVLDGVYISPSTAQDCFKALAKVVPQLRVLSLQDCGLQGYIHHSLSRFESLVVINLSNNEDMSPGPFPEFFMNFVNLSVLQLAGINLEGWFPHRIFQLQKLKVLDLSRNQNLSGHMPNFANESSLETLRLDMTNFSYVKSSSSGNFKSLMELGLDRRFVSTDFLSFFGTMSSLSKLVLSRLGLLRELGLIISWIKDAKNSMSLELYECDFSTTIPSTIGNSKSLRSLEMYGSKLTTLSALASLINLRIFAIYDSEISGQLPPAVGNMSNLEILVLSSCQISGPIPLEVGALAKLRFLVLSGTSLSGSIPSSTINLTRLIRLELSDNYLSGEIPTYLYTLPALRGLFLWRNQLSGPIHEFKVVRSRLTSIALDENELTGQIPQSLLALANLTVLSIAHNNLKGSVDLASLWKLENLTDLDLSGNKLSVTDEQISKPSSTYLSRLRRLGLANCNITKLPNFLTRLNHMVDLDLSSNKINGDIPKWIWERWSSTLSALDLSHNMFSGMELNSYVLQFDSWFETFDLSSNRLQGRIPMPSLSGGFLDYSNNAFSSVLPNFTLYLSGTIYLGMSNNNISGYLPHSICASNFFTVLDLASNNFRGPIPACLMENEFIRILNLRENHFEGTLPSNISSECSLQTIDLNGNKIEGQLPRALCNCNELEVLDLGRNQLAGYFPFWLGTLLNLRVLVLRSNQLYGSIGYMKDENFREYFASLQIIDLSSNNFSGSLHPLWFEGLKSMEKYNNTGQIIGHENISGAFYQDTVTISYKGFALTFERILTTLTAIDLSDNALEGNVPESIGRLVSLRVLNMSHNSFTGEIPRQLGGITALESLDLSSNKLSGEIPQELTNVTFLSILNLSNNQLEGRIPLSRQFATFENNSFDGNVGLCGPPLSKQCGASDTPSEAHLKGSSDVDIILYLFVGVGFGVGFAAAVLVKQGWVNRWLHIATASIWRTWKGNT